MNLAKQIEDAGQSGNLTLLIFYADWSPHYEWIPSFILMKNNSILWQKTGEVFPGELKEIIEMFKG